MMELLRKIWKVFSEGDLITILGMDRWLPHIVFIFFLVALCIYGKFGIDHTLLVVEKNKVELDSLRYIHSEREYELVRLGRLGTVEELLKENGSTLARPEKPAEMIK